MSEAEEDVALDPEPVNVQLVVEPAVVGGPLAGVLGTVGGGGGIIGGGGQGEFLDSNS